MPYFGPLFIALITLVLSFAAPFIVPFALPFIRWDNTLSAGNWDKTRVIRGDLPSWLSWLGTPDERLPGNLEEPSMRKMYQWFGPRVAAWYWLGVRNRLHGLAFTCALPLPNNEPWSAVPGFYKRVVILDDFPTTWDPEERILIWWLRMPILGGRFQLKAGWRSYYIRTGDQWYGVPCLTITRP